jgi:CSLREA domain-containing protein
VSRPAHLRRTAWLAAVAGTLIAPVVARAATIAVTTTADAAHATTGCSLRDAIGVATVLSWSAPGCTVKGSGAVTVRLTAGTYRLTIASAPGDDATSGDLDVSGGTVSIVGAGASATIVDASALGDRILHVHVGASVTLDALTLRGGRASDGVSSNAPNVPGGPGADGGGVLDEGSLTVVDATFSDNRAGNGGAAASGFGASAGGNGGSGGAVFASGSLVLERVTLDHNAAGDGAGGGSDGSNAPTFPVPGGRGGPGGSGGAIASAGPLTVRASTLTANHAGSGGRGGDGGSATPLLPTTGAAGGDGGAGGTGGALLATGVATLGSDTIAANAAGSGGSGGPGGSGFGSLGPGPPGAYGADGPTGGVAGLAANPVTLVATILAGNAGGNCDLVASDTSHHDVRWGDSSCAGPFAETDPLLGPLADNGGPTWTMMPAAGSLVADIVPATTCRGTTDQRGVPRPFPTDGPCDVGAVEAVPAPSCTALVVGTHRGAPVTIDAGCTDLVGTLQATVVAAPRHGTVTVTAGLVRYRPRTGFVGNDALTFRLVGANGSPGVVPVAIVVTRPARCVVPQLVGVPLATATARLRTNGCQLGRHSGGGATVSRQGSRAGAVLARGARVALTL